MVCADKWGNMKPDHLRSLGSTNIRLPVFGFGGAPLGELFAYVSEDEAHATLQKAWDLGIRYFDTAPWYGRDFKIFF